MHAADRAPAPILQNDPPAGRFTASRLWLILFAGQFAASRLWSIFLAGLTGDASTRSSYLPALDGLRALAVIAVLFYHARPGWLPGGFLGVEVFFVISGFIITRALLNEWDQSGRIRLQSFWLRRARRLLPAVCLLLVAVLAYVAAFQPDEVARLRGDILAALAYVTNWHLVLGDQSYFDSFQRPSMLRHLWSLAVEEQFYIVWPLVLAFGLPILKRRGFLVLIVAGIAASTIGMALLYDPMGDNSRAYFGTDTRAGGLLVGAFLAFALSVIQPDDSPRARHGLVLIGAAALVSLAAAALWLDEGHGFLYQGGFLAVSLASAAVILAVSRPNAVSRLLGAHPLRWLGVRSYGIYLWHWPIYMLIWPREATLAQLALQIPAVVAIAAASYVLLEKPVREGALARVWERVRAWRVQPLQARGLLLLSGSAATALIVSLFALAVTAKPPEMPSYFQTGSIRLHSIVTAQDVGSVVHGPTLMGRAQTTISALTTQQRVCTSDGLLPGGAYLGVVSSPFGSACPEPVTLFASHAIVEGIDPADTAVAPELTPEEVAALFAETQVAPPPEIAEPPAPAPDAGVPSDVQASPPPGQPAPTAPVPVLQGATSVTAIGDSVMLGAAYVLAGNIPGIDLDASVGRQANDAIALLKQKAAAGALGQVVVVHIGNNGTLSAAEFDQVMAIIGPDRTAVFLSVKVPRAWQAANNAVLTDGVAGHANAVLVDWAGAATTYSDLLYSDGIHLTPAGASYYTQLVVSAIAGT